jgi:hypothetical protein
MSSTGNYIVRPIDGQDQTYNGLPASATIRDLKERIFVAQGIPVEHQKLIFGPEIMDGKPHSFRLFFLTMIAERAGLTDN